MGISRIAISVLAGLPLLAQYEATGGKGVNFYTLEKEAALGKQMAAELRLRTTPIDNPTVQDYVDRLGQKLAENVPKTDVRFTFSVIAEDPCPTIHEPAALPGGYLFVPAALFLAAQDEAEFAGMLAHAMEHIAERHGTRQATRGQITNYASVPLIFMGNATGCAPEGAAVPLGYRTFQWGFERQADFLAVQTMAKAGFDPNALVRYTERVQSPASPVGPASRPLPPRDQRVATMKQGIGLVPAATYPAPADAEFAAAQDEMRRFVPPARPSPPSLRRKTPE